jgi:hypothetical protein
MAKQAKGQSKKAPERDPDLPEGFEPMTGGRVAGWFLIEPGNSIQGFMVDSFEHDGQFGRKKVYKIEVTSGTTRVSDGDGVVTEVAEGALVGLDERGWLKRLGDVEKGREIFVKCIGKEPPNKANRMKGAWKFTIGVVPF